MKAPQVITQRIKSQFDGEKKNEIMNENWKERMQTSNTHLGYTQVRDIDGHPRNIVEPCSSFWRYAHPQTWPDRIPRKSGHNKRLVFNQLCERRISIRHEVGSGLCFARDDFESARLVARIIQFEYVFDSRPGFAAYCLFFSAPADCIYFPSWRSLGVDTEFLRAE